MKDYKIDGLSTSHNHLNTEMIQTLKKQGTDCHVWTINDARQAKKFIEWGVDSITTDIPHSISKL